MSDEVEELKDLWKIVVVEDKDNPCPRCGAYWGHPDETLNFPNRSKVGDEQGVWWWRCYNPKCEVQYFDPISKRVED